jgi:hypothetical protein
VPSGRLFGYITQDPNQDPDPESETSLKVGSGTGSEKKHFGSATLLFRIPGWFRLQGWLFLVVVEAFLARRK